MSEDGNIVAAKARFADAIHALIDPQPRTVYLDGGGLETTWLDSWYMQLRASTGGQNVAEKGDSRQGRLPIWVDAVDLLREIDREVCAWKPDMPATALVDGQAQPATVSRLAALDCTAWRPQDTEKVAAWTATVREWSGRIKALLDPQSVKHISAPCPACGQETVYRKDNTGQVVRQPALQLVTAQGCTCLACRTHWEPSRYLFLCRLLGFELPEGVLE